MKKFFLAGLVFFTVLSGCEKKECDCKNNEENMICRITMQYLKERDSILNEYKKASDSINHEAAINILIDYDKCFEKYMCSFYELIKVEYDEIDNKHYDVCWLAIDKPKEFCECLRKSREIRENIVTKYSKLFHTMYNE
jgi:hypothetical protein